MFRMVKQVMKKVRSMWIAYYKQVVFKKGCSLSMSSTCEGKNMIQQGVSIQDSSIGRGTFIGSNSQLHGTSIGRYCSIGPRFNIIVGRHPTHTFVSTHPAFYSTLKQSGFTYVKEQRYKELHYADEINKRYVVIGHDVWIGADVRIVDGVTIGDGAVIGANSLVLKDVEPYAVVAGNPAKVIRYRFDPDEIELLLKLRWWDQSETWLQEHVEYFRDIKKFYNRFLEQNLSAKVESM